MTEQNLRECFCVKKTVAETAEQTPSTTTSTTQTNTTTAIETVASSLAAPHTGHVSNNTMPWMIVGGIVILAILTIVLKKFGKKAKGGFFAIVLMLSVALSGAFAIHSATATSEEWDCSGRQIVVKHVLVLQDGSRIDIGAAKTIDTPTDDITADKTLVDQEVLQGNIIDNADVQSAIVAAGGKVEVYSNSKYVLIASRIIGGIEHNNTIVSPNYDNCENVFEIEYAPTSYLVNEVEIEDE